MVPGGGAGGGDGGWRGPPARDRPPGCRADGRELGTHARSGPEPRNSRRRGWGYLGGSMEGPGGGPECWGGV